MVLYLLHSNIYIAPLVEQTVLKHSLCANYMRINRLWEKWRRTWRSYELEFESMQMESVHPSTSICQHPSNYPSLSLLLVTLTVMCIFA